MNSKKDTYPTHQDREEIRKIVKSFTLFDDDLMSRVFNNNIEATELVLRIILGRDVKVTSVIGQYGIKSPEPKGHDITLDILATDVDGTPMNIEVQGNSHGSSVKRARYHSGMIDAHILPAGKDFDQIKDSYVIFIYKNDKFSQGLPLYHIDRFVRETGQEVRDGSHIIYVNGSYRGNDAIGKLMADFNQQNPGNMIYQKLAESVKNVKIFKEEDTMCDAVEEYGYKQKQKGHAEGQHELILKMADKGLTAQQISELTDIAIEEITTIISGKASVPV